MPHQALVCWIGNTDLKASSGVSPDGDGPVANAVSAIKFDEIHLLCDYPKEKWKGYVDWLSKRTSALIKVHQQTLSSPTNFRGIYKAADSVLSALWKAKGPGFQYTFHLSPGTPSMAAVWILLAKTSYPAQLLQSSREAGVEVADVPFDIAAEFIPDLLRTADQRQVALSEARPPEAAGFEDIVHRSPMMKQLIAEAHRAARRSLPILIEGESGTGKELFAQAIHNASPRAAMNFVAVNCGAIPAELLESEFFGHKKGAFSGAVTDRLGHFGEAHRGTLFLDEIGELPKAMQTKLLRALQQGEVTPVGQSKPVKVDVRIIAATNRTLVEDVAAGRFREDLLYRLAVAVIKLPPIRERKGDLNLLIDAMLDYVNRQATAEPGYQKKKLSVSARNLLLQHHWPGNVRELQNTLLRASLWSEADSIGPDVVKRALMTVPVVGGRNEAILDRDIETGVKLEDLMAQVARHYLQRALEHAKGNKTQAANLVGFSSYQTLTNWLKKYGLE
ncbi:MAG TPA: sigma 54-interacting transcriptional regulator [Edaphobacter sp.]|uniref:sigma-54 interaction domain-containing protein n=1 Tax=Edaphobacter sp. TaxID=1934404 RepID=UPI002C777126|nr:sigma 54-interacting transcriptional regulator [Edaphobacter sp.]HUZ95775.1 sigma 54-interacting transcriptional regulator [Edaphobacter sp.]